MPSAKVMPSEKDIALLDFYYINRNKLIIDCQSKDTTSFLLSEINLDSTLNGEDINYSFLIPMSHCSNLEKYFNISLINSITYKDEHKKYLISGTLGFTDINSFFPDIPVGKWFAKTTISRQYES